MEILQEPETQNVRKDEMYGKQFFKTAITLFRNSYLGTER
jgi:hypothetical protein